MASSPVPKSSETGMREAIRREIAKGCYLIPNDSLPYASKAITVAHAVEDYLLSDAVVERAARALWAAVPSNPRWDLGVGDAADEVRDIYRERARTTLSAAFSTSEVQGG